MKYLLSSNNDAILEVFRVFANLSRHKAIRAYLVLRKGKCQVQVTGHFELKSDFLLHLTSQRPHNSLPELEQPGDLVHSHRCSHQLHERPREPVHSQTRERRRQAHRDTERSGRYGLAAFFHDLQGSHELQRECETVHEALGLLRISGDRAPSSHTWRAPKYVPPPWLPWLPTQPDPSN